MQLTGRIRRTHDWQHWDPENESFWAAHGKGVARRNLVFSVLAEHIGFSVWSMFAVLALFMGPEYGIDPAGKFTLVAVASLTGAALRVPYGLAVARFGGRRWTVFSAALLLVPCGALLVLMEPGTSYGTFLLLAALTGVGGANFASSMSNINSFYPERLKGWALGVNAGGGNIGVAAVQLVALLVIATAGADRPRVLLAVYLPLIVVATVLSAVCMDDLPRTARGRGALRAAVLQRHTWILAFLYIGTFGSFIGYSFAFGLVLQSQFGRTPLAAASLTFLGPLLGSLTRPLGGRLADRLGGARVTLGTFVLMAGVTGLVVAASLRASLALFLVGFAALFVLTGIGNGSTYKMIPLALSIPGRSAEANRNLCGAAMAVIGAVGAFGGLGVNIALRESFASGGTGTGAYLVFLGCYLLSAVVTWAVYVRPGENRGQGPRNTGEMRVNRERHAALTVSASRQ